MKQTERIVEIRQRLAPWYQANARDLPWRRTRNPYAVWISEIMLQQTQVATVIPYYLKFLKRFPDVQILARAKIGSVLKCWEGLGYYTRARKLHEAARVICREYGGNLPSTPQELMLLPGIGKYTAGAIASIAFKKNEPVLDGNVTRVFCRLFRIREMPDTPSIQDKLWQLARQVIRIGSAGQLNQALMELGAMVCRPKNPECSCCPVQSLCLARKYDQQNELPLRRLAKAMPHDDIAVAVIWKNGRILIDRRKPEGLLGGLWEFPGGKRQKDETLEEAVVREVREELGIQVKVIKLLITVKHAYSHFKITLHAFECRYISGKARPIGCDACKWVGPQNLRNYAFPRANQKIIPSLVKPVDS